MFTVWTETPWAMFWYNTVSVSRSITLYKYSMLELFGVMVKAACASDPSEKSPPVVMLK